MVDFGKCDKMIKIRGKVLIYLLFHLLLLYIYYYIYIYIYCHPQTDCFIVSLLFSVARHFKLG